MARVTCPPQQELQKLQLQRPQLDALAVGVNLIGHGDGFSNFTYLVVPSVQDKHPIVDPPSLMHPSMPLIRGHREPPCATTLSFACQSAHDDIAAPHDRASAAQSMFASS